VLVYGLLVVQLLAGFVKTDNIHQQSPKLWSEQVNALGKQGVDGVAVIFQPGEAVADTKTHFAGLTLYP
jgi:hypothetical protein